jgi:hypothetical protein
MRIGAADSLLSKAQTKCLFQLLPVPLWQLIGFFVFAVFASKRRMVTTRVTLRPLPRRSVNTAQRKMPFVFRYVADSEVSRHWLIPTASLVRG